MYYYYVKDEYCSEEIYKCISIRKDKEIIIGLSEYDFLSRKELFERIFENATVLCVNSLEINFEIINRYKPSVIVFPDNFPIPVELIRRAKEDSIQIKSMSDCMSKCTSMTNRLAIRKKQSLKSILERKGFVRVIETNCGLTSMLLQDLEEKDSDGNTIKFDAFWMSSLCDSLHRGKPDNEITDLTDRLNSLSWTREISPLPILFDLDSGGSKERFLDSLISLYNRGVSAVVIEDKIGDKINSLSECCSLQKQDMIESFSEKIRCGRKLIEDDDFTIIARIESLILGNGIDDAVLRAEKYIEANADAILIHYNKSDYNVVKEFCERYNKLPVRKPLVVVPTKYSFVYEKELIDWGVNIVIYANHITRSIVPAVLNTGSLILKNRRALEASVNCISVADTLRLVKNDISRL